MLDPRTLAVLLIPLLCSTPGCDGDSNEGTTTGTTGSGSASASGGSEAETGVSSNASSGPAPTTASTTGDTTTDVNPSTTGDTTTGGDPSTTEAEGDTSTGTPIEPAPPVGEANLLPWLEAGNYARWAAEAQAHPSAGPHFTAVRTFMNAPLLEALEGGSVDHPVGSAVVKELYGDTPELGGWAVMIKTAPGSSVDSWYWYEWFTGTTYADDNGVNGCGNCHSAGVDFVRTSLPL